MSDPDPEIVYSRLCRRMEWEGVRLRLNIYRLDDRPGWALEVVNDEGTSTVWDEVFATDGDADAAFRDTLAKEGVTAFLDGGNVVPFPGRLH